MNFNSNLEEKMFTAGRLFLSKTMTNVYPYVKAYAYGASITGGIYCSILGAYSSGEGYICPRRFTNPHQLSSSEKFRYYTELGANIIGGGVVGGFLGAVSAPFIPVVFLLGRSSIFMREMITSKEF